MLKSLISNYCIFFRDNRMEFGWIEGIQKNKAIVVPIQGKKQFLPANRIIFSWKDKVIPLNSSMARESIALHIKKANDFKKTFEIQTMHSLLDDVREYSLNELSENFLDDPKNIIDKLGLFITLREDTFWFKHNRNLTYTPRTHEELALLKIQILRQEKLEEKRKKIQKWIKQLESGEWNKDSEICSEQEDLIKQIQNLLIKGADSRYWKELSLILKLGTSLDIVKENKLKKWISKAGETLSFSKLTILRADVKEFFSNDIYAEVKRIKEIPLLKTKKISSEIPTFTIDSEKTLDYDDAFSVIEWNKNNIKIIIHIADLSHNLSPDDSIFKEAESRISSVYTVEKSFPMLPKELSNDNFSLKSGKFRNVLSFFFILSKHGDWNLIDIESRIIKVQQNLSYKEANKLIEEKKDFWDILNKSCQQSQKKRIEKGALNIYRKEYSFDIRDPENIRITLQNRNSPSNRIIEELAISVNSEAGKIFRKSNFPGIYRTQSSYEIKKDVEIGKTLSMEHIRINPTRLSSIPDKHAGLGCEFYMQITSPIRRFSDLVMQFQLKMLLEKKDPIFSENDIIIWLEKISYQQKKYKKAETEILNYWKLRYVKQNLGEVFKAKTRKKLANGDTEVELLELDLKVPTSGLGTFSEGEHILIKINLVEIQPPKLGVKYVENETEKKHHIIEKK